MSDKPYIIVDRALRRIATSQEDQPGLAELAAEAGLSEHHFQRVFKAWAGISPKKFLQYLTLEAAKQRLRESSNILDAAYDVGLSGPSRLHDLFVALEAMTPGTYKQGGEGLDVRYGYHDTPFGECLLAVTDLGICGLGFVGDEGRGAALADFQRRWPKARFTMDSDQTAPLIAEIFKESGLRSDRKGLSVVVPGTAFQHRVWRALLEIPPGSLVTYGRIADYLGLPRGAARAVGQAVGANPVSWLIPCHRVIRETGAVTGYHWGTPRKLAMIGWEAIANEEALHKQDSFSH